MQAKKLRRSAVLLALAAAAACSDVLAPPPGGKPTPEPGSWNSLGLVEVTLTDLGGPAPTANATVLGGASGPAGGASRTVSTISGGSGNGSIQLRSVSSGSFTVGTRGAGGYRYVYSSFQVRNAASNGTPYDTDRHNLTLLAVATPSTLDGTAVSRMSRYDGSAASASIATGIRPTGAVAFDRLTHELAPHTPDVLQAFDESEVAAVPVVAGGSVLPWGFQVSHRTRTDTRTLPATPGPEQWDGVVTFAFKVPLQATAAADPFTVSFVFLAVDDPETRLTLSPEEQTPAGLAAAQARALGLGAELTTLGGYRVPGARRVCSLRTAGTAQAPTAGLFAPIPARLDSLTPSPRATGTLGQTAQLGAVFDCPTTLAASAATFVVKGSQSGRAFLAGGFTAPGGRVVSTPAGAFFPGEEVEVVLRGPWLGGAPARVAQYRVAVGAGLGTLQMGPALPVAAGTRMGLPVLADLNRDGRLDMAVTDYTSDPVMKLGVLLGTAGGGFAAPRTSSISGISPTGLLAAEMNGDGRMDLVATDVSGLVAVFLGDGAGGFSPAAGSPFAVGASAYGPATGDFNGDGHTDLALGEFTRNNVLVLLGDGAGGFLPGPTRVPLGGAPISFATGDANGDGRQDLITQQFTGEQYVHVLLGDGAGGFAPQTPVHLGAGKYPWDVTTADLNGDGQLDVAAMTQFSGEVFVMYGRGDGTLAAPLLRATLGCQGNSIRAGDLTGDRRMDLVVGCQKGVVVLLQDAAGGFTRTTANPLPAGNVGRVALADVNGDRLLDAVAQDDALGVVHLLLNP